MSRKKRNPVGLTASRLRFRASKWFKQNKDVPFDVPTLTTKLGMDGDSRNDTTMVYRQVINYWRKKFIQYYNTQKIIGKLKDMDRYRAWETMLYNYNQNDAYVFLYSKSLKQYIQPISFKELEDMDRYRLEKQWKGIGTVIEEMQIFGARLVLPDGSRKPIGELLDARKEMNKLLDGKQVEE